MASRNDGIIGESTGPGLMVLMRTPWSRIRARARRRVQTMTASLEKK